MKKISLGVLALLLASATVFANDAAKKPVAKKAKQECQGKCLKSSKTGTCTDKKTCPDMKTCGAKCS